ncbi:sulfurtransferase-like selenium metabolism protein YedF [Maridesulfovibrio bastinii]|uniref:sulfurtransferase-like selenium metabolism protein YedF n=1 Tax=Maridesulfovibrio bastinii TaxID=47157 RepID=UPI0003FF756A|nr:sulfurtransferase-like selenium metabolism protein YedF [Maridesulfovibrio bastinii]
MAIKLECQGLPCPQPVLKCKQIIENDNPESFVVVVDNEAAKENVSRFVGTKGYKVNISSGNGLWTLTASKDGSSNSVECEECTIMSQEELDNIGSKTVVFITSENLGSGDDVLGSKLMFNFVSTLPELGESLWRIVMVNSAVKLATEGNPCLEKLQDLEKSGVSILVCGTCLDHFKLLDKKQAGETTNMLDVVTSLQLATKVIKV